MSPLRLHGGIIRANACFLLKKRGWRCRRQKRLRGHHQVGEANPLALQGHLFRQHESQPRQEPLHCGVHKTKANLYKQKYSKDLTKAAMGIGEGSCYRHRSLCWVKTKQEELLVEEVEAASPCLLLLRRHFLLLLQYSEAGSPRLGQVLSRHLPAPSQPPS